MLNKYLFNLYKQYCGARGITCTLFDAKNLSYEFLEWIANNKLISKEYSDYLCYLGYFDSKSIAEIGKGRYDSIYTDGISIISPYADTMEQKNKSLFVVEGFPLIEEKGKIIIPQEQIMLTHNPYEEMKVHTWHKIHNLGQYDISVGVYGNVHDNDFEDKIKLIKKLSSKMTDDNQIDYDTDNDKYFCTLNSKRKIKIKVLKK